MGRSRHNRHHTTTAVLAIGLTLVLLGAGCSGSDDDESAATVAAPTTAAPQAAPASTAAPASGGGSGTVSLASAAPAGAALAIEATITIEVDDVRQAVIDLPDLVESTGGAIYDTDIVVGDPETAKATITVKVRPQNIEDLVGDLGTLGRVVGRSQQTEDVADQIADTDARIATAQASVDRVRALLASAADLDEVVRIENELTLRETTLEQLLADQRNLGERVQLATVTIVLRPAEDIEPVAVVVNAEPRTMAKAWHTGWRGFTTVVHGIGLALAYSAPFAFFAAIAAVVALTVRRRTRKSAVPAP